MFRKRVKKHFPSGTFLPNTARVFAILQLCIAFTLIAWYASQPFMGKHFAIKSRLVVFESVFSNEHYSELTDLDKDELQNRYDLFRNKLESSFWTKLKHSGRILFYEIPPFERVWLLLSVILPIFLLKKREGAWQAAWLLPLVVLFYALDNQWNGKPNPLTEEEKLFPTEIQIMTEYVHEPLSTDILKQREQLLRGWQLYLVREWAKETPGVGEKYLDQVNRGEFAFTVARAKKLTLPEDFNLRSKEPTILLCFYLIWNTVFAWIFFRHRRYMAQVKLGAIE